MYENNDIKKKISKSLTVMILLLLFGVFLTNVNPTQSLIDSTNLHVEADFKSQELPNNYNSMIFEAQSIENIGITWENISILDSPYQPITLNAVIDSNNITHVFFSSYENGRSLFHLMILANGTIIEKETIFNQSTGQEIKCDAAADNFGKVHLVYSYSNSYSSQKVYYRYWDDGSWSSTERVDYGEDDLGNTVPAHSPIIEVDQYGVPHVLWSGQYLDYFDKEYRPVYYQRRIGVNQWSDVIFTTYSAAGNFRMTITNDDIVHVISSLRTGNTYAAYQQVFYNDKGLTDTSWGVEEELWSESLADATVTITPTPEIIKVNNTIHVFFESINDYNLGLYHTYKSGSSFETYTLITDEVTYYGNIELSAIASVTGDITLVWPKNDETYNGGLHHAVYIDSLDSWTEAELITVNYSRALEPTIVYGANDTAQVFWYDLHPDSGKAVYFTEGLFDYDQDGISNNLELTLYLTDPLNNDTDADLLLDGDEISLGYDPLNPDEDSDQLLDGWEISYGLDPNNATDANEDNDADGLINLNEFGNQTDPFDNDTDDDLLLDGDEIITHGTNPINPDTDYDDLNDGLEINVYSTNATNPDTEADGMPDGYEVSNSLDPLVNDSFNDPDIDLLTNIAEYNYGTNPQSNDTDADLLDDYDELFVYFTNPLDVDSDNDILTDYYELMTDPLDDTYNTNNTYITNPNEIDTDSDQLSDYYEVNVSLTNPILNDTDGDLMTDGFEILYGLNAFVNDSQDDEDDDGLTNYLEFILNSNPNEFDTDNDRLTDLEEYNLGTNLSSQDTDNDGLTDYSEIWYYHTIPTDADPDNDGLIDSYEVINFRTSPFNNDTDADTLLDGDEVFLYNSNPLLVDTDEDGLTDSEEIDFGSLPYLADSDNDEMDDYFEFLYGFDPTTDDSDNDFDGDGLTNGEEFWFECNPTIQDTDNDRLSDYVEAYIYLSSPINSDSDGDSISDYDEVKLHNTSPTDSDSDDDGLPDNLEVNLYHTDPLNADSDNDGSTDYEEIQAGTDPLDSTSRPQKRFTISIISSFIGIIGGLTLYYLIPFTINKLSHKEEREWTAIGLESRQKRTDELLKDD